MRHWLAVAALILGRMTVAPALEPENVFVVSNRNMPDSQRIAEHYLVMRSVPKRNHLALDLPASEEMTRADYQAKLLKPLQRALYLRRSDVKVLLMIYGVPLRVGPRLQTEEDKQTEEKLKEELKAKDPSRDLSATVQLQDRLHRVSAAESQAAVDSELMLLWWPDYPLSRWLVNPLYFACPEEHRQSLPEVVMTARIDGPSPEIALRLINDAVAVEARGLKGRVYVDARGIPFDAETPGENGTGYAGYDQSFREAADILTSAKLHVTLNDQPELFQPGSCRNCAIYTGWYSLANYVPACEFVQGAVAWHLASSEAVTLRNPDSKVWCPNLLKDGAAVTLGPVAEPYTIGFPKPAEFFGFLATGKYTVVECYAKTIVLTSWMGVLIGDPLYNPFAKTPLLEEKDIHTSPKGITVQFLNVPHK